MDTTRVMTKFGRIMDTLFAELLAIEGQGQCIAAGAVLTSVLRRVGFSSAYPLAVMVDIFNPAATKQAESVNWKLDGVKAGEDTVQIRIGDPDVDLGPGIWRGHLVVIVPNALGEKHLLLDPTIVQANHPGTGIEVVPLMVPVADEFIGGKRPRKVSVNGSTLFYWARREDESFHNNGDYTEILAASPISDRVLARLAVPS